MSATNETTNKILAYLFDKGIFAWRNSVGGGPASYTTKGGVEKTRWMQMGKPGSPDIMSILPVDAPKSGIFKELWYKFFGRPRIGLFLGIEVKTGKDRLRPEQEGFIASAGKMGAQVLVIKDFDDFLAQFSKLCYNVSTI